VVHAASLQDRDGAKLVLHHLARRFRWRLRVVYADSAYAGALEEWCWWVLRAWRRVRLVVVGRRPGQQGFEVLPKRWIVERTFAWLGKWKRLGKDYELLPETGEALIRVAMIGLMLRRLAPAKSLL
jgi:putative transposase